MFLDFVVKMLNVYFLLLIVLVGSVVANPSYNRVVGGNDAVSKQFPHQISLRRDHSHVCGGSIISDRYILTAAHCVVFEGTEP